MADKSSGGRITFIETDDAPDKVRAAHSDKKLVEVDLFVHRPPKKDAEDYAVAARLCSCRRVCVAIIEA